MIWRSGKLKPCCYFCDINLPCILQFILQLVKLLHSLSRTGDNYCQSQDRAASNLQSVKRLHEILRVDLHQVERRLRIISRTRPKAPQESSEEIYCRFHFVNSSETFQHLCGFSRKPLGEPPKHFPLNNTLSSENYT